MTLHYLEFWTDMLNQLIVILTVYELQKWVKFYQEKLGVVLTRAKNLLIVSNIN